MAEEKNQHSSELLEMGGIILKYLQKDISPEQEALLKDWVLKSEQNKKLFDELKNNDSLIAEMKLFNESIARTEKAKLKAIEKVFPKGGKVKRITWYWYAASVVLLIMMGAGFLWHFRSNPTIDKQEEVIEKVQNDVAPGQNMAKVTLADGSVVVLDSFSNNRILHQGRTKVYSKNGQLIYQSQGKQTNEVLYNILTTAKGQMYSMVLSDGSIVWLNAQSSIKYPVNFIGDTRRVEIIGEAYFDVKPSVALLANGKIGKRPFVVDAPGISVEVLGTHFNINSYSNEDAVKTTLLEGKVKVHSKSDNAITNLQPGQQAKLDKESQKLSKLSNIDVNETIAWRYGYFQFGRVDLRTVLRQLSRWYDVDVEFRSELPVVAFGGKISRNNTLSQVLETLESNDVHFKLEGRKIVVSP